MSSYRGTGRGNFRANDGRRYYQNREQQLGRPVWQETARYQQNPHRPPRDVARGPARHQQVNPNTRPEMPGIPVSKNQSAKPFDAKTSVTADGAGDNNVVPEQDVEAINQKLLGVDLEANENKKTEETVAAVDSPASPSPEVKAEESGPDPSKEVEFVSPPPSSAVPATSSGPTPPRRYTVSSTGQSWRANRPKNDYSHQKYHNNYHSNVRFQNDPNKKYKPGPKPFVVNGQTDFGQKMAPTTSYAYNNVAADTLAGLSPYYLPQYHLYPQYPTSYTSLPPMPTNGVPEVANDQSLNQKAIDCEAKKQSLEIQPIRSPSEPMPMSYFGPYIPSDAYPQPPRYFGHIVTYKADNGLIPFFICDVPNNIAPLQLEVAANGVPIVPCNCTLIHPVHSYQLA